MRKPPTGKYVAIRTNGKSEWEHRLIAAKVLGRPLPARVEVHHFDNNGRNNAHRNLVICENRAYHCLLHQRQDVKANGGDPNLDLWCSSCKRTLPKEQFYIRKSGGASGRPTSVCRTCTPIGRDAWLARKAVAV